MINLDPYLRSILRSEAEKILQKRGVVPRPQERILACISASAAPDIHPDFVAPPTYFEVVAAWAGEQEADVLVYCADVPYGASVPNFRDCKPVREITEDLYPRSETGHLGNYFVWL